MAQTWASSRALGPSRHSAAFATTVLLIGLSSFAWDATTSKTKEKPGAEDSQLAARSVDTMHLRRPEAVYNRAGDLPDWNAAWKHMLRSQIDELIWAVEERAALQTAAGLGTTSAGDMSDRLLEGGSQGFQIHVIGDSTMKAQATMLKQVLLERTTSGGKDQCYNISPRKGDDVNWADVWCTGTDEVVHADGNQKNSKKSVVLSLRYTKTYDGCASEEVDADFVYFGCGMHFLQLIPVRFQESVRLDAWVHYGRLLEEAVLFYRSGGGKPGNRVPVGEAFMTTHSVMVDWIDKEYKPFVREYALRNESLLATCREAISEVELIHTDWPNEYEPEEICTLGVFDDGGVAGLNRRAEDVMGRLGVPIVKGYDMTKGQAWVAPPHDGRHYKSLLPVEVSSMLMEVTTALRRERDAAAV